MKIISGPASKILGKKIGNLLNVNLIQVEKRIFPDGESYIRLMGDLKGKNVVIIQTIEPPQNTNLIELLLLIDTAHSLEANSITVVIPYFAYSRQDKRFKHGEALSIKMIIKLIELYSLNTLW